MRTTAIPLAPDPALPQRDALLDADQVAERLARVLGHGDRLPVEDCRRVSAHYRPGRRLRVLYSVTVDGRRHHVAARAYRGAARTERACIQAQRAAVDAGPLRPVARDAALDTVFWTFPNDRKIGALPMVAGGSSALSVLVGRRVAPRLVAYAPERAATAACVDGGGVTVAYAKVLRPPEAARVHAVQRALRELIGDDDPAIALPRALAWSPRDGAIVSEALPGRTLDTLEGVGLERALHGLGAALARLHRLSPACPMRYAGLRPLELVRAAQAIADARPDAAPAATALLRVLLRSWPAPAERLSCLHGDPVGHNALLADGRIALIDLDAAGYGPAAADLGRVLAWLRARRRIDELELGHADRITAAVICGYGDAAPLPSPATLRWHVAASLLTARAARAVSLLHPGCAAHLRPLLADARDLVG